MSRESAARRYGLSPIRHGVSLSGIASGFLAKRWVRFGIIGGCATLSYFLLGLLFVNLLRFPLLLGNAAAYALSFIISYAGQSRWTFKSGGSDKSSLPKFAAAQLAGLGLNSLLVDICARIRLPYELSMLIATAIVPLAVYLMCKFWVFRAARTR